MGGREYLIAHFSFNRPDALYKLFEFIRSIYVVLLFILIEAVAVHYYAHSTYYTQARLLTRSNRVVGGVYGFFSGVGRYFTLGRENEILLGRVVELETRLAEYRSAVDSVHFSEYMQGADKSPYRLMTARVISNSVNRDQNFVTLDKGRKDGVVADMAVLSPDGAMVGYVVDCSERYAVAMSALNTSFRASGKLSGGDYFGSIHWDGLDRRYVVMTELSKYAEPQPGDEVVSTGFSLYFPADIPIGEVESSELNENKTAYTVRVRLAADLTALDDVILVENTGLDEIKALQASEKVKQTRQ